MLVRRFHAARAVIVSLLWCGGLRLVIGPVVALPFGPVVAPVWLFAIFGAAMICLPIVSSRLVTCEGQAVRSGRRLRAGRAAAFTVVYGVALSTFAAGRLTVALLVVALACAGLCLVLAAVLGDAAVVVVLAVGLVVVFASTYPWFAQPLAAAGSCSLGMATALVALGAVASVAGRG
ncbi:hypothetical protein [Aeromicrobium endophyticum]|uniref:Uncharacterized protein n=1 Tax=Aeromicrobium endophyticum TaxID=2292704 RepID=A0A371P9E2_9ACTN|nr:hypothetical protein [Aeromicrobium endophyticum]REK72100.1 hypothetical protein DX116_00125 [Aeromicrobium endophyticum]